MEEDDEENTERRTAELKVSDLEEELAAVLQREAARLQKEVGGLERANGELKKEFAESLEAQKWGAELEILREREQVLSSMEETHSRELAVRDELKEALELLLKERELKLEGLKLEMETARNAEVAPLVSQAESVVKIFTYFAFWQCSKFCPTLSQTSTYFPLVTPIFY